MNGHDRVECLFGRLQEEKTSPAEVDDGFTPNVWNEEVEARELEELADSIAAAFGEAAATLSPQTTRIRHAISRLRPLSARRRRTLRAVLALYGCAAALLALLWIGYGVVYRLELRKALTASARIDVRNLARALERWAESNGGALPSVHDGEKLLELLSHSKTRTSGPKFDVPECWIRNGVLVDAFGCPLRYRWQGGQAMLYSCGPNGRDDGGGADDIAVVLRPPASRAREF